MAAGLLLLALTYLLASVPFGLLLTLLAGGDTDIRGAGSGNIGTTNVARLYGWRLALMVLLLDVAKGFVPVMYAFALRPGSLLWWPTVVAAVAFIGHCFPIYLGFRGGKGVATGGGAMLAIAPWPTTVALGAWGLMLALTGRSSVASLGATTSLVLATLWWEPWVTPTVLLLAMGVVLTHTGNIQRLAAGEEGAVMQRVRWGRTDGPSPGDVAALLEQGPAGTSVRPSLWREEQPAEPE